MNVLCHSPLAEPRHNLPDPMSIICYCTSLVTHLSVLCAQTFFGQANKGWAILSDKHFFRSSNFQIGTTFLFFLKSPCVLSYDAVAKAWATCCVWPFVNLSQYVSGALDVFTFNLFLRTHHPQSFFWFSKQYRCWVFIKAFSVQSLQQSVFET